MKNQLDWMKQSMSSNTQKTELLLENTKRLKELFQRVDQIEVWLCVCVCVCVCVCGVCVCVHLCPFKSVISFIVQAFVNLVSKNLDLLEESVTSAEKTLDPSTLQKVFKVLPGLVRQTMYDWLLFIFIIHKFPSVSLVKRPIHLQIGPAQKFSQHQITSSQHLLATLIQTAFTSDVSLCMYYVYVYCVFNGCSVQMIQARISLLCLLRSCCRGYL